MVPSAAAVLGASSFQVSSSSVTGVSFSSLVTSTTLFFSTLSRDYMDVKGETNTLLKDRNKKEGSKIKKSSDKVKIVQYGSYELEEYQVAPMSGEEK